MKGSFRDNCLGYFYLWLAFLMAGCVEGIRRALVLGRLLITGTAIEQAPSVGLHPHSSSHSSPRPLHPPHPFVVRLPTPPLHHGGRPNSPLHVVPQVSNKDFTPIWSVQKSRGDPSSTSPHLPHFPAWKLLRITHDNPYHILLISSPPHLSISSPPLNPFILLIPSSLHPFIPSSLHPTSPLHLLYPTLPTTIPLIRPSPIHIPIVFITVFILYEYVVKRGWIMNENWHLLFNI